MCVDHDFGTVPGRTELAVDLGSAKLQSLAWLLSLVPWHASQAGQRHVIIVCSAI